MNALVSPKSYPPQIREDLLAMPPLAQEIANRWVMGWPQRVKALVAAGEFLPALRKQEEAERDALADPGLGHLALHEKVQMAGLTLEPPIF